MGNLYKFHVNHSHPLSYSNGSIQIHREVAYDSWGEGPHQCRWCSCLIDWHPTFGIKELVVDHLDSNTFNNAIENLVPSCRACNSRRAQLTPLSPGHWYKLVNGRYQRWAKGNCINCGAEIDTRVMNIGTPHTKCCSDKCRSARKALSKKGKPYIPVTYNLLPGQTWVLGSRGKRRRGAEAKCLTCGAKFGSLTTKRGVSKYCSHACYSASLPSKYSGRVLCIDHPVALKPGELFVHSGKQRSRAVSVTCLGCGALFLSKLVRGVASRICCSSGCAVKYRNMIGYHKRHRREDQVNVTTAK